MKDYFEEDENRIIYKYKENCFYKIKIDDLCMTNIQFLKEISSELLQDKSIRNIIVDMDKVFYADSSTMGMMLMSKSCAEDNNVKFTLVNLSPSIKRTMSVTGLDSYFNIEDEFFKFPVTSIEVKK